MVSLNLHSPYEMGMRIAKQAKEKRLAQNLTQRSLAERSGVSLGSLKKFERTGKISLESLLKLALVLEALEGFAVLFAPKSLESYVSLDQMMKQSKKRRRGRK